MTVILKNLKPTALGGVFLVLGLALQALCFSSISYSLRVRDDGPAKTEFASGIGSPIVVIKEAGKTRYQIGWPVLVLNLTTTYAFATLAAALLSKATRLRRPAISYASVAFSMIGFAFVVSIGISRAYWGYFLSRPPLLREAGEISKVAGVIPIDIVLEDSGKRETSVNSDFSLQASLTEAKKDSYYCLDERILVDLERRNILPETHVTTLAGLPDLYSLINGCGILVPSDPGYTSSDFLRGVVIDALDRSGRRILFVGLTGKQLSNDHYPCYEMAFKEGGGGPAWSFSSGQRFFYDVAGMEGFEWYGIWPYVSLLAVVAGFALFTIIRLVWRWKPGRGPDPATEGLHT